MSKVWEFDRAQWFTTSEMLDRGWPRYWLEPFLGHAHKLGPYKLWARDAALHCENHPIWTEARAQLNAMAKGRGYLTREQQEQAIDIAIKRFDAGELPPARNLQIKPPPPEAEPSEWPRSEWTASELTLTWECGGKVVIPTPFLEAVRQGLGETGQRLALGVATVLSDWRSGRVKPNSFATGRSYFLAWLKNTLIALQQLETKREFEPEPAPVEPEAVPPTLH